MGVIDDIEVDLNDKNIMINKNALYIRTSNKTLVITYLQMPNKNIISSSDAFNAYKDYFNE
jgi:methionyl-tRNA formyltransferase